MRTITDRRPEAPPHLPVSPPPLPALQSHRPPGRLRVSPAVARGGHDPASRLSWPGSSILCIRLFAMLLAAALLVTAMLPARALAAPKKPAADDDYAILFGTVWSAHDRPVYGVHLRLRRASEKKFRWEAMSDHRGEFAFHLPVGEADYILVTDWKPPKGSALPPIPDRTIHIDQNERQDIGIHLPQ